MLQPSNMSFAYKVIYVENGLIVMFPRVRPFNEENIKVKTVGDDLILELGRNIVLVTEKMLRHLVKTQHLFLYESPDSAYEASERKMSFSADKETIAKVQGAWEVLRNQSTPV